MEREKATHPVRRRCRGCRGCRVLGVSPSAYWAWRREPSARSRATAQLTQQMGPIQQQSRGAYGALRVQAELKARGLPCGQHRVARLLRQAGLVGCHRRRPVRVRTTQRDLAATPAPDLAQRSFTAPGPDRLWIADITYLPTEQDGFLSLAVLLDGFSRRVVGWSMQAHLRTELVLAATDRAGSRRPGDGGGEPAAGSGADAALRSGMSVHVSTRQYTSVHVSAFRRAMCGHGDPSLAGVRRRWRWQRHGGTFLRHPRM
jgi:transposase InsO family protein